MPHETFVGPHVTALLAEARAQLGPHAVIVSLRRIDGGRHELVAASDVSAARAGLAGPGWPPPATLTGMTAPPVSAIARRRGEPELLALVGPTGSGKTTTIAKLASRPDALGGARAGWLCLDTHRVGAVEQARAWAALGGIPFAVAADAAGVPAALKRLKGCEWVLVDTPGRGPRQPADAADLRELLVALAPREVHLTLPAGLDPRYAARAVARHRRFGVTHLLATKCDECPDDEATFDLAIRLGLPMRWLADGQSVPEDLGPAWPRVLARQADPLREEVAA